MQKITKETLNKKSPQSNYYSDEPREFPVGYIQHKSGTYRIEINAGIEDVSQFSTAIQVLDFAKEDDEIEIHLSCCPGGSIDASGTFLHALHKCQAPIHIIASGNVSSAATHILLCADSFELAENFNSLIHNGSGMAGGNLNEWFAMSDFYKKFLTDQYKGIYQGFLTDDEIEGVMRGDQIWLDAEGWYNRAMKRMEYFQAKAESQQEEQQAAVIAQMEAEMAEAEPEQSSLGIPHKEVKITKRKTPIANIA